MRLSHPLSPCGQVCPFLQTTVGSDLLLWSPPEPAQVGHVPCPQGHCPQPSGSTPPSDPFPSCCDLCQLIPRSWDPLLPPSKLQAHIPPHQVTHHLQHASAMSHVYNPLTHMCTHDFPCEHASSHTLCNAGTVEWSNCFLLSITTGPSSSEVLTWGPAKQLRLLSNQTSCLGLRRLLRNSRSAHITGGPRGHPDFQVVLGVKNPPANAET